ncbi:putative O-glycosylation ligase, exosortase A system-associated [Motilimonas sp. 1_MG-2023]|uniref:putative O-glycosylation ligase, exosortase A system-associated n=1 Tax=Motilimonas TaxID=1914248 RepID=UPI0026E440AC|nr:putative O-glycosylation ligase, exosortase A system-associated [Motilimonas sp. 1_MG-2023]MDO6524827.1 putative O-glycosylation ligase, exosortase A system-associated [Motilimonas sp. 1_MG-2023]
MRDIALSLVYLGLIPFCLKRPMWAILVWSWLSYMNPHRLVYGFAYSLPFAQTTAILMLIALLVSKEKFTMPWKDAKVWVLLLFILCMVISTFNAFYPNVAWLQFEKVMKIQVMVFASLYILTSYKDLKALVWVIVMSIGFYGVKGGIFTISTGGVYRVQGPADTFFYGNNEVGLAILIIIPLVRFLAVEASQKWMKISLNLMAFLCIFAVVGTHSRGALVGGVVMAAFLCLKSKRPLLSLCSTLLVGALLINFVPKEWTERMNTIETFEEDKSALGRINAWQMASNLSSQNVMGGGFEAFQRQSFYLYAPEPNMVHDAHSIYFEVLGEHGFIALFFFLLLWFLAWRSAQSVIKSTNKAPPGSELASINQLMRHVQVSFIAYLSGGAFLGMAYFDLPYHLLCIIVIANVLTQQAPVAEPETEAAIKPNVKPHFYN